MPRNVVTIEDLSNDEIESVFDVADSFLTSKEHRDRYRDYRVKGRSKLASKLVLATLFFEPSTRTRLSFESAMVRLGGHVISSPDAAVTSAAKGESLADTVRVIQNYADAIVLRHPLEGAARVAAHYARMVPVINAGDGSHEHPTQTLCDLYTLRRQHKKLGGLRVLLCGDLRNGRTIHSLVLALARFDAKVSVYPAPGMDLPEHVYRRLASEYNCIPDRATSGSSARNVDAFYLGPSEEDSHQLALFSGGKINLADVDVFYVTRHQKERLGHGISKAGTGYPVVDRRFLDAKGFRSVGTSVLHPLPRVDELGYDLDKDERGMYFKQASYGVPVRMALLAGVLGLNKTLAKSDDRVKEPAKTHEISCQNARCISTHETKYLDAKFLFVKSDTPMIRCYYCDHEVAPMVIGRERDRTILIAPPTSNLDATDLVFFANEDVARSHDFAIPSKTPILQNM